MARPRLTRRQGVLLLGTGTTLPAAPQPRTAPRRAPALPGAATGAALPAQGAATRVLGLDLALGTTGWCLLVAGRPAAHGHFVLPDRRHTKAGPEPLALWLGRRAAVLGEQVSVLVQVHHPEVVGYEYPDVARPHYSGGTKGREFAAVQGLSRAEGFLVALWPQVGQGVPLVSVPVTRAKQAATGRVNANKDDIRLALMREKRWPLAGWTDDEVDAGAVALAAWDGV